MDFCRVCSIPRMTLLFYISKIRYACITLDFPGDTWRYSNVIITSKRRCDVVLTQQWRYYYVMCFNNISRFLFQCNYGIAVNWNQIAPVWPNSHILVSVQSMMTSSNGNIFRVTGHLCGEFTGPRWIPRTKVSDAELWCFLWSASE